MKHNVGLLVVFLCTGLLSLGFWWVSVRSRGEQLHLLNPALTSVSPTLPPEPTPLPKQQKLVEKMETMVASASGTYAVEVFHLDTGERFGIHEHAVVTGASILKVPAMATVLRQAATGVLSLDDMVTLQESDRRLGSGPLQYVVAGTAFTYNRLIGEMGRTSDNTAWVMVNRSMGRSTISQTMKDLQMNESIYETLDTTAFDVTNMWVGLYKNSLLGVQWEKIADYLVDSIYEDRIPESIPVDNVEIVHKVGTLEDAWMDAGVVRCKTQVVCGIKPFVIVVMNTGVSLAEAKPLVGQLIGEVWNYEKSR